MSYAIYAIDPMDSTASAQKIFDAQNQEHITGQLSEETNGIPSLTLRLYPGDAGYNSVIEMVTRMQVHDYTTGETVFNGRVLQITTGMDSSGSPYKDIICEGIIGYLQDSAYGYGTPNKWTAEELITNILERHNSVASSWKKIQLGNVTVSAEAGTFADVEPYQSCWEMLSAAAELVEGYLQIRTEDGVSYLDWLKLDTSVDSTNAMYLGVNLQAVEQQTDPTEFCTRLYAWGKESKSKSSSDDTPAQRINISSVNDGKYYIDSDDLIEVYGIIHGTFVSDDSETAKDLLTAAKAELKRRRDATLTTSVTAVDLVYTGDAKETYHLNHLYKLYVPYLGINDNVRVIGITRNIESPYTPELTLGTRSLSMRKLIVNGKRSTTEAVARYAAEAQYTADMVDDTASEAKETAEAAKAVTDVVGATIAESQETEVSIPASTATAVITKTIPAGIWVVTADIQYPQVSSARRVYAGLGTSVSCATSADCSVSGTYVQANYLARQHTSHIFELSADTDIYVTAQSNVACTAIAYLKAVRIK